MKTVQLALNNDDLRDLSESIKKGTTTAYIEKYVRNFFNLPDNKQLTLGDWELMDVANLKLSIDVKF